MNVSILGLSTVLVLFFAACDAILSGSNQAPQSIPDVRAFGCQWLGGGRGAALNCTCTPDAELMHIKQGSIPSFNLNTIWIQRCPLVIIDENAVKDMRNLREIHLADISNLTLGERSLHWEGYTNVNDLNTPTLRITILDTTITQISSYAFMGKISHVAFERVRISAISPFAFSSISQSQSIGFYSTEIENILPQAFKKFSTENLVIEAANIAELPSRTFSDLTVSESVLITNSNITVVRSGAFTIFGPRRFEVTNSNFDRLEGESFRITTRGDVVIRSCRFNVTHDAAFLGLSLDLWEVPVRKLIHFDNLIFGDLTKRTLLVNATSFDAKITDVILAEACECRRANALEAVYTLQNINCFHDGVRISYQDFKGSNCSILASNAILITTVCTALILALIIGTVLWCYFKRLYRSDSYGGKKEDKGGKLNLIVPDGRTYRETELHVIVERTDLLTTDL